MRIIASSALLFLFAVSALASQEEASPAAARPLISDEGAVYAKVILPVKAPAGSDHPAVESWIARKLRKQGATVFTAATGWVRLPEKGEDITAIWDAILNGAPHGCPVYGQVDERTDGDRVSVTLSGWAPFPPKIKGASLPADIGSRRVAIVDTGRVDGMRSYVALMIGPAPHTESGEQDAVRRSP